MTGDRSEIQSSEGGFLERGDGHRRPQRGGADLDVEGVVAEEELGDEEARDEHDEVLAGALLVLQRGRHRLGPVGPDDVSKQLRAILAEEPVRHVLLGAREDARVLGGHGLVAEEHLPLADLEAVVVALHHHVPLGAPVLHRHGGLDPQRLVHGRLHQRHLRQRLHGHLAAVRAHGVAHLRRQPPVRARAGAAQPLDERREQDLHAAEGVEAHGEQDVVHRLLPRNAEALALVDDAPARVAEEVGEPVVVLLDQRRRQAERVEQGVLDVLGQAQAEQRAELEQHPLGDQLGPVALERRLGGVAPQQRLAEEGEGGGVVVVPEVGLADPGQLVLHVAEEVAVHLAELGDHVLPPVRQEVEEERLERPVVGLAGVEVREHAVAAGEVGGRHEGAREEVRLVDERGVEEHREGGGVEERHHARVARHEGARRHVEPHHGGAVRAHAGGEEPVPAAGTVEVLEPVADRAQHRQAVVARHLPQREPALRGHHLARTVGRRRGRPGRLPPQAGARRRRCREGGEVSRRGHRLLICSRTGAEDWSECRVEWRQAMWL